LINNVFQMHNNIKTLEVYNQASYSELEINKQPIFPFFKTLSTLSISISNKETIWDQSLFKAIDRESNGGLISLSHFNDFDYYSHFKFAIKASQLIEFIKCYPTLLELRLDCYLLFDLPIQELASFILRFTNLKSFYVNIENVEDSRLFYNYLK